MDKAAPTEGTGTSPGGAEQFDYLARAGAANLATGDVSGIQAGVVHGNIIYGGRHDHGPVVRRATEEELHEVHKQFVEPVRFADARRAVQRHHVAVLCGRGSGRSFAARRLLVELGVTTIAELHPDRDLGGIRGSELDRGGGYIWEADETMSRPLRDQDTVRCAKVMRDLDSWLVIVLDQPSQVPESAARYSVELGAPPPLEVAQQAIHWRGAVNAQTAEQALGTYLAGELATGDPPGKAVRAAELAIRVATDPCFTGEQARDELREDVGAAVVRWSRGRRVIDYAMSFAVAVLENQPYDEVVELALDLDMRLREAELAPGESAAPRPAFSSSRDMLLGEAKAEVVLRPHPTHKGLSEETVRFRRQDWAAAVLHHVWRQHPAQHAVLWEWMCSPKMLARFTEATRRALCSITAEVPAHDPLRLIDQLAAQGHRRGHRLLAASALVRLADEHDLRPLVQQTLDRWTATGTAARQWTAAVVHGSEYGRRDLHGALATLERLAMSKWATPRYGVVQGMFDLLIDPACQRPVVDRALAWATSPHAGPRQAAHSLGLHLVGLSPVSGFDPARFEAVFPARLSALFDYVLADGESGKVAVDRLAELAFDAEASERAALELVRIARLIAPDLRWWKRWRAELALVRRHPRKSPRINWVLRMARRQQKQLLRLSELRRLSPGHPRGLSAPGPAMRYWH